MNNHEEVIEKLFERGMLVNKELLEAGLKDALLEKIETEADMLVLNTDYAEVMIKQTFLVDWYDIDRSRVEAEKDRDEELYQSHLLEFKKSSLLFTNHHLSPKQELSNLEVELGADGGTTATFSTEATPLSTPELQVESGTMREIHPTACWDGPSKVMIQISYINVPKKFEVKDFTGLFVSRYRFLEKILRNRQELQNILSIHRALGKKEKEKCSIIGMVGDINITKSGNLLISLEDLTGNIKVLFSKNNPNIFSVAKDLVHDEIVGLSGTCNEKLFFADSLVWPDIPSNTELKKKEDGEEECAIFLSDIHVGSALFLKEEFEKFLLWITGQLGDSSQREMANKVKYIFMAGDLVDGVGVYPSQETELEIKDIAEQYAALTALLKRIPPDKRIIICPGNHDVVHLAEPQPVLYPEYAAGISQLPNVLLVTNPAVVNIAKTEQFPGFDVLMYHGYSFDYYVANVDSIRNGGGYHRADLIMKFLLKRRHLAPSFKSTPYFPGHEEDPLLIKKVPDFFVTGHIHYSSVANYKGVTMISCSCWQGKTTFQEKLGHQPEPARVPFVNLRTREIKVLRFG